MPKHLIGAISLFVGICLVSTTTYFVRPILDAKKKSATSAVGEAKGVIRIGGDKYAGYFPLVSDEITNRMLIDGYRMEYIDDSGDYKQRIDKLYDGQLDLAVFTIDSYLLNGELKNYPGSIITVLSESKGSDAVIAEKSTISSLDYLREHPDTPIAFTPDSPSHHLLKTIGVHFGSNHLLNNGAWRMDSAGSDDAWRKLEVGEVPVAVLWEPEVTQALSNPKFVKLLGTESTSGLIVDVLVANRDYLAANEAVITTLLKQYFSSLKMYRTDKTKFIKELAGWSDVSKEQATNMINGITWMTLYQNATEWFGVGPGETSPRFDLLKNIDTTLETLMSAGDFSQNPLLNNDPRAIIFSDFIEDLASETRQDPSILNDSYRNSIVFEKLTNSEWEQLQAVGTLEIPPVQFQSGSLALSDASQREMKKMAKILEQYPSFRVLVEGHTSPRGDPQANIELSQQRAEAVAQYLTETLNLDFNRVRASGLGQAQPLSRNSDESYRAYMNRLSRVEIKFVSETM